MSGNADTPSVVEQTRSIAPLEAGVVNAHFLGRTAALVLGDNAIVLVPPEGEPQRVAAHEGAILTSVDDGARVVSGGDDGRVVETGPNGETRVLASDSKHRWI